ncbi:MAG: phenylacetate--CoA ligase [Candidatus Brocadiaceae bacterium]|jgi:phenylacetate-CoA ligase
MQELWDKDRMPQEELRKLQLERLRRTVAYVREKVPFYQKALREKGVTEGDIEALEDVRKLPLTVKDDLRDSYPFGLFAVPLDEIVRTHCSSGTTGKPIVAGYTQDDIDLWSEVMARTFHLIGVTPQDICQVAWGYGLFTGGLGAHYGLERLGATVIPISGGNTERQVMLIDDFGVTVWMGTPSYAMYLIEVADEMGIDFRETDLRIGIFGAEPWTEEMRVEIEQRMGVKAYDIYGLTEIIGPGVSSECEAQDGLHIFEDHFLPELLDPETLEPTEEEGELVFTTITKTGMPVLRFRTRDITRLHREKCSCGRTTCRMERVTGRSDDMLIIRGVNVFPSQIEAILLGIEGTQPHYQIVVQRKGALDDMEVHVEVEESFFSDKVRELEAFEQRVRTKIENVLGLRVRVRLMEPGSIERSLGKAKRVIDQRQNE